MVRGIGDVDRSHCTELITAKTAVAMSNNITHEKFADPRTLGFCSNCEIINSI